MNKLFALMAMLIGGFASQPVAQQRTILPEQERGVALVKAEVIEVVVKTRFPSGSVESAQSTLKISHVYSQPASLDLFGRTFQVRSLFYIGSGPGPGVVPVPTQGEQGLWTIANVEQGMWPNINSDKVLSTEYDFDGKRKGYDMFYPARRGVPSAGADYQTSYVPVSFAQAENLAEFVEQITKSEPSQALLLLRNHVFDEDAVIATWSISTLSHLLNSEEARVLFHRLISQGNISSQMAFGTELTRLEGSSWQKSPQWGSLVNGWSVKVKTDEEVVQIIQYFQRTNTVDINNKWNFFVNFFHRDDISQKAFDEAITTYASYCRRFFPDSAAFDVILAEMKRRTSIPYRLSAAYALRIINLAPKQLDVLKALLSSETNPAIRAELQSNIYKSQWTLDKLH